MAISLVLLLAFLIGGICGLRSMTGPALICWGAHLGWLSVSGSHLAFLANFIWLIVFSLLAIAELFADKLPKIPRRTSAGPLALRVLVGGLCGGAFAIAGGASLTTCSLLGGLGGLLGAFAGYWARRAATAEGKVHDLPVALFEDLIAIGGGLFLISRF
ncbi:MAG TPA: DUF4126 family protein [Silvibacterium sp.]|nr:DUF4126 family protein [Silvibacterium sp.]